MYYTISNAESIEHRVGYRADENMQQFKTGIYFLGVSFGPEDLNLVHVPIPIIVSSTKSYVAWIILGVKLGLDVIAFLGTRLT